MMSANSTPPSAVLLPTVPVLRERLAVALREVDLLRRLIRAAESVCPNPITTADCLLTLDAPQAKGAGCG
jgi:hypothetical protein